MANNSWRGDAIAIAQVTTVTIGTYDATTTYTITINGKNISQIGTGGTATTTATALLALLQATTVPQEFKEMTWTSAAAVITGTAVTAGKPFTLSTSVSGGTGTISNSTTTTSSGPNDASIAANWSTGSLPATGDNVYFDAGSSDCKYGLTALSAVNPANVYVLSGFTGNIGLPRINSDNTSATYFEYRQQYLQFGGGAGAMVFTINGGGGRIKFDCQAAQATWNVTTTGQRADSSVPTLLLKGTSASNALNISKGDCAVAFYGTESATLATLNSGYQTSVTGDVSLYLGEGVTITGCTIVQTGGSIEFESPGTSGGSISSLTIYAGTFQIDGTSGISVLTMEGGTCVYNSTGTLGGTPIVAGKAKLDFGRDLRSKTISGTLQLYGPTAVINDPGKVTGSLAVKFNQAADVEQVNWGTGFTLTRS